MFACFSCTKSCIVGFDVGSAEVGKVEVELMEELDSSHVAI